MKVSDESTRRRVMLAAVAAVALLVNFGIGAKLGLSKPMTSDAFYFRHLAENMVSGKGYVIEEGFWPDSPTMRRLPAWPFLVSIGLRVVPFASHDATMRILALLLNAGVSVLIAALTHRLFKNVWAALIAGVACAIHPTAIYEAVTGMSEPLFLALAAGGILLLLSKRVLATAAGGLLLGCACLVRANFVLVLPFAVVIAAVTGPWTRQFVTKRILLQVIVAAVLFSVPPVLWARRNARLTGTFPVFSTLRGQTFYGGNNPVVADQLEYWGYWIFPDSIPGETPMRELASRMSEYEVDEHYYAKGQAFIRQSGLRMPRLWLGKLVRAYVPVPWKPSLGSYAVSAYRWLLFLGTVIGLLVSWRRMIPAYTVALGAMLLTSMATVVGFWGCARFALAVEPFFMPFAGITVASAWSYVRSRVASNLQ